MAASLTKQERADIWHDRIANIAIALFATGFLAWIFTPNYATFANAWPRAVLIGVVSVGIALFMCWKKYPSIVAAFVILAAALLGSVLMPRPEQWVQVEKAHQLILDDLCTSYKKYDFCRGDRASLKELSPSRAEVYYNMDGLGGHVKFDICFALRSDDRNHWVPCEWVD